MPANSSRTNAWMIDERSTKRAVPPSGVVTGTTRGSERGAWTIGQIAVAAESVLCRQPHDEVQALVLDAGKGRAGSSPSGLSTGSTSRVEVVARPSVACSRRANRRAAAAATPAARSAGSSTSFRQAYWLGDQGMARSWMACELLARRHAVGAALAEPSSTSCFRPATRISKNSSRLLDEMHRNFSRSSSGTLSSSACASTRCVELQQRTARD